MSSVTVGKWGTQLVAVKRATGTEAERLRTEARLIEAFDHPGIVGFVEIADEGDTVTLRTTFAGSETWASRPLPDPRPRAAGVAMLAATIADLHGLGYTHGAVRAEHVIHGPDHRPILCSLGRATRIDGPDTVGDLDGLAALVCEPPVSGPGAASLDALADRLRSGELDARGAVDAADRIAADLARPDGGDRQRRRRLLAAGAIILVVGTSTGLALSSSTGRLSRPRPAAADVSPAPTDASADAPTSPTAAASTPPEQAESPDASTDAPSSSLDPSADASMSPTATTSAPSVSAREPAPVPGPTLDHQGRRYQVGAAGDLVLLGDWDCDGVTTPAAVTPDSGAVALFDRWPDPSESVTAADVWLVGPVLDAVVESAGDCDQIRLITPDGSRLVDTHRSR